MLSIPFLTGRHRLGMPRPTLPLMGQRTPRAHGQRAPLFGRWLAELREKRRRPSYEQVAVKAMLYRPTSCITNDLCLHG